ncbi:hypothetical protein C8Q78DRAFT_299537 [Trametes maxima]|nr:hypothetical protein C8Q78DRAFT_299537 [Trametes maxima]
MSSRTPHWHTDDHCSRPRASGQQSTVCRGGAAFNLRSPDLEEATLHHSDRGRSWQSRRVRPRGLRCILNEVTSARASVFHLKAVRPDAGRRISRDNTYYHTTPCILVAFLSLCAGEDAPRSQIAHAQPTRRAGALVGRTVCMVRMTGDLTQPWFLPNRWRGLLPAPVRDGMDLSPLLAPRRSDILVAARRSQGHSKLAPPGYYWHTADPGASLL